MRARPILASLALPFLLLGSAMAVQSPDRIRSQFAADRTAFSGIDRVAFDDLGDGAIWVMVQNLHQLAAIQPCETHWFFWHRCSPMP